MNQPLKPEILHTLSLADGTFWMLGALDAEAAAIVAQLGCAMRLPPAPEIDTPVQRGQACRLLVEVDAHSTVADCYVPLASARGGDVVCILSPSVHWGGPFVNLTRLSLILAREAQARRGLLIHGALAERNGRGVILAAPGGTGKTTASKRLPAPWRSCCDDTTLVVRDAHGNYWAHPWPTWSRFLDGGAGGAWEVSRAVPLDAVFILNQALEDRTEPVGPGCAVSLLMECAGQAAQFMPLGLRKEERRTLYEERFDNLAGLTRKTPVAVLHLSLAGTFWREMERTLDAGSGMQEGTAVGGGKQAPRLLDAGCLAT